MMYLLLWLQNNWRYALTAFSSLTIAYLLHTADVHRIEANQARLMEVRAAEIRAECTRDKQITTEVAHEYETKVTTLHSQLARLKRVLASSTCVPVTVAAPELHGQGGGDKHAGPYGVTVDSLLEYGADAETYRIKLTACQDFIRKTWAAKGQ